VGQFNRTDDNPATFLADPEHAARPTFLYLVEVNGILLKLGIAVDVLVRGQGSYTAVHFARLMPRANSWAVEQAALWRTLANRVNGLPDEITLKDGWSELRHGLDIAQTTQMLDAMADECERIGWERFWQLLCVRQRLGKLM
jgi:hypothetical protein